MPNVQIFVDHQDSHHLISGHRLIYNYYADRISLGVNLPRYAVAVICVNGGEAAAIGTFRRGAQVTSFDRRYEISEISLLDQRVPLASAVERLLPQVKTHFASALSGKVMLPEGTSQDFIRVLSSMSANAGALIERAAGSPSSLSQASESRRLLLAEEKDSLGVIADLAGLGRAAGSRGRRLVVLADEVDPGRTYLESVRLQYRYNDEDALIDADMSRFDGILGQRARRNARGMVMRFPDGTITVMNTNKSDLESVLGCDLIYYNSTRNSALLVQYKRMSLEGSGLWVYRGDAQLVKEMERMREVASDPCPTSVAQYRLHSGPQYLKVVRPTDFDGQSAELMDGMYIPLSLVDLMLESHSDTTRGGNLRIAREDGQYPTQRHINNTMFTNLFRDGWIGSFGTASDELRSTIEHHFDADELVTIAIDDRVNSRAR